MLELVSRLVFPLSLVSALAVWVRGYADVGDGFAAGAIAGLGAITQYVCLPHDRARRLVGARGAWLLVVFGLWVAVGTAIGPNLWGGDYVRHMPAPGEHVQSVGMLEIHTAALFDLGVTLLVDGGLVGTFDRLFPFMGDEESGEEGT